MMTATRGTPHRALPDTIRGAC